MEVLRKSTLPVSLQENGFALHHTTELLAF